MRLKSFMMFNFLFSPMQPLIGLLCNAFLKCGFLLWINNRHDSQQMQVYVVKEQCQSLSILSVILYLLHYKSQLKFSWLFVTLGMIIKTCMILCLNENFYIYFASHRFNKTVKTRRKQKIKVKYPMTTIHLY